MTILELQSTPKFFELFSDQRFLNIIAYMREHPYMLEETVPNDPTAALRSEGAWQGWFRSLKKMQELGKPSVDPRQPVSGLKYAPPEVKPKPEPQK